MCNMNITDILIKYKPLLYCTILLIGLHLYILFQMVRMSTGHMEGDLQPLYLLLTDCYIYLLRKGHQTFSGRAGRCYTSTKCLFAFVVSYWFSGAAEKPYSVEEAVSYNELDYISVSKQPEAKMISLTCCREIGALVCALGGASPADYHSGVH